MLESDDPVKQVQGAFGLNKLGNKANEAVPALVQALKSRHTSVRENAALALGNIASQPGLAVQRWWRRCTIPK